MYGAGSSLYARWLGLEAHNAGWQCRLGGVPCAEQSASPSDFDDPQDWEIIADGTTFHPDDLLFDTPSASSEAAALGWVRYERFATTDVGAVGFTGQKRYALYAQDEFTRDRWTVLLGLRADRVRLQDTNDHYVFGFETTFAPHLGVSYDPTGEGRQKLFAHYGRYYDPVRDNVSGFVGQYGAPRNERQFWIAPLDGFHTWRAWGGPDSAGGVVAPVVRTPRTDEFMLGYSTQLGDDLAVQVAVIRRQTRDVVDDFDPVEGLGDPELYPTLQSGPTLAGLGFQDRDGDGDVDRSDIDADYVVYNPPGGYRDFTGVDLTVEKRMAKRWQLLAGYSYADATGSQEGDSQMQGTIGDTPYWDPRLPHNRGPLAIRKHTLKAWGSYMFPFGLEIGAALVARTGSHYGMSNILTPEQARGYWDGDPAKLFNTLRLDRDDFSDPLGISATLPDGSDNPALDDAIMALMPFDLRAGRGAYEHPSQYQLDLRFRYLFEMRGDLRGELFVDVYNLFNRQHASSRDGRMATVGGVAVTPENISDRTIYAFQMPTATQSPRRFRIGLRLSF